MAEEGKSKETVDVQGHFEEKATEAAKAQKDNKEAPKTSLVDRIKVEFIKEIGYIQKGAVLSVSQTAFELYDKQKAVKKL